MAKDNTLVAVGLGALAFWLWHRGQTVQTPAVALPGQRPYVGAGSGNQDRMPGPAPPYREPGPPPPLDGDMLPVPIRKPVLPREPYMSPPVAACGNTWGEPCTGFYVKRVKPVIDYYRPESQM